MKRLLVPFVLLGASLPDRPQPSPPVLTQAAAQLVVAGAPGVTVLVRKPGKTIRFARGVANRTTSAPLQSRQPFRIGSITKTFVATVVLQLAGERTLTIDVTPKASAAYDRLLVTAA